MGPDAVTDFGQTIESMLLASIPAEPMSRLCNVWSSLNLEKPLSEYGEDVYSVCYNLLITLKRPDQITDEEARETVKELWLAQEDEAKAKRPVSQDAMNNAPEMLRWLK